jgi:hypothetical protein
MKKLILALVVLVAAGGALFAFDPMSYPPPVDAGNILVDVGVGFAFNPGSGSMSIPPISLDVEYTLSRLPISVGGALGTFQYKKEWSSTYTETFTYIVLGAKGNWHWGLDVDWLDLYTGLFLGYRYFSWDWDGPSGIRRKPSFGGLAFGGQIGAHFYFTKNIGAVVELGAPFSRIGLAFKF